MTITSMLPQLNAKKYLKARHFIKDLVADLRPRITSTAFFTFAGRLACNGVLLKTRLKKFLFFNKCLTSILNYI